MGSFQQLTDFTPFNGEEVVGEKKQSRITLKTAGKSIIHRFRHERDENEKIQLESHEERFLSRRRGSLGHSDDADSDNETAEKKRRDAEYLEDLRALEQKHAKAREEAKHCTAQKDAFAEERTVMKLGTVMRVKLAFNRRAIKSYELAKQQGKEYQFRQEKLLSMFCLLSVLNKLDEYMQENDIIKVTHQKFLRSLPPPPPPPPMEAPPTEEDERVHYEYERRMEIPKAKWIRTGQRLLGVEQFNEIINKRVGPAESQKKHIILENLRAADEEMNEQEHQALMKKAWRLQNNWKRDDEYTKDEGMALLMEALVDTHKK